jgi:autotransporter translocation and assembly factor TamB
VVGNLTLSLRDKENSIGMLVSDIDWSGGRLALNAAVNPPKGSSLTASGTLPYALSLAPSDSAHPAPLLRTTETPVDFRLHADGFDIATLAPLLDPKVAAEPRGMLTLDAHVSGKANDPQVGGAVRVSGGQVKLPSMGVTYREIVCKAHWPMTSFSWTARPSARRTGRSSQQAECGCHDSIWSSWTCTRR